MLEISSYIKDTNMLELATKTNMRAELSDTETKTAAALDEWAKEVGNTGHDRDHEIAAYITRTINESMSEYPNQLLDLMFDVGSIGEFDAVEYDREPKNTLVAFEAAQGGNVERSFIDVTKVTPTVSNLQVETDIRFADLRRNGWKTVARLTEFATSALENRLFASILNQVNSAIMTGDNYIDGTGTFVVTQELIDRLSLYLHDWAEGNGTIVSLSK